MDKLYWPSDNDDNKPIFLRVRKRGAILLKHDDWIPIAFFSAWHSSSNACKGFTLNFQLFSRFTPNSMDAGFLSVFFLGGLKTKRCVELKTGER